MCVCLCVCVCVCVCVCGVELRNKVIQNEKFNMKESRLYNVSVLIPFYED